MSTSVFIERSRLGKVFYEVKPNYVRVSGHRSLQGFSIEAEFHALSPRVERLSQRFYRPILICLSLGGLMAAITLAFALQKKVAFGAVLYFAEISGIFAVVFLASGIRWLPRLEVARFKDAVGRTVFDVVKEKSYAAEFEEFVAQLQRRIAEGKMPHNAPATPTTVSPPAKQESRKP